jgi:Bacteriophage head to tail connecting protein
MKTRVQELIKIGDQLYSKRFPLLTLWQTFAENFYPLRADMTRVRYISEEFASYLMTGRPVLAHRELSNAISAILRPRNMEWFKASTGEEEIDKDPASQGWLEAASRSMRRVMYDQKCQFTRATKEGDADFILFGQCVIEPRFRPDMTGMIYRTWHLRDCVWAENSDLEINQFHRKWQLGARQLYRLAETSGWETLHQEVKTKAEKDPFTDVKCRIIILPADEYDSYGKGENGNQRKRGNYPFVRITIDEEHQTILEEVPQLDIGHVIPRWVTIGGFSQYAYSPTAIVALPDARMLQQMTLTLIEIGQKSVDPPMIAVGDAIQGGTNLYAGAINWVDPDYDERTGEVLRPIPIDRGGIEWGTEYEERVEKVIQEAFFLNVLNLPPIETGDKMTATEVEARMREYIQRATPLFEPMDLEYNGKLCQTTFQMMDRIGAFGSQFDRPPPLRGRQIEFKFVNPLIQAEGERKLTSFTKMGQLLGAAMQFDPNIKMDTDIRGAYRDAFTGTGAPSTWLVPKEQADQLLQQQQQQQQALEAANQVGHIAEQGGKAAAAVTNVGQAATSLQDAGLAG